MIRRLKPIDWALIVGIPADVVIVWWVFFK